MENPKTSLIERLQNANNVLVTVSANPSVDQLAAAIGMTLFLNKLGKHAAAVFSGEVPSTLEFLKPEETFEKNTDSLRDFIIALDKSKADKLRYKVEDKLVKIFITPYHASLSQDDLEFSQGDFNVDVVLALGVQNQKDLDQAITAHGRILHDATVVTVNTKEGGQLGSINWVNSSASSLCEMAGEVCEAVKKDAFDAQMATALLTGIVAETQRFSNTKTTSSAMNMSARLMAAGANQQLVATKLEQGPPMSTTGKSNQTDEKPTESPDGSLEIEHDDQKSADIDKEDTSPPERGPGPAEDKAKEEADEPMEDKGPPKIILEPPTLGGTLTASGKDKLDPSTDPLTLPPINGPLLSHDKDSDTPKPQPDEEKEEEKPAEAAPAAVPAAPTMPEPPKPGTDNLSDTTLDQIEESVDSPHTKQPAATEADKTDNPDLDAARQAVEQATSVAPEGPLPQAAADIGAIGDMNVPHPVQAAISPAEPHKEYLDVNKLDENTGLQLPSDNQMPNDPTAPKVENSTAPPPVPPPLMPEPFSQHMPTHGQQPLPNAENDNNAQDPLAPL